MIPSHLSVVMLPTFTDSNSHPLTPISVSGPDPTSHSVAENPPMPCDAQPPVRQGCTHALKGHYSYVHVQCHLLRCYSWLAHVSYFVDLYK